MGSTFRALASALLGGRFFVTGGACLALLALAGLANGQQAVTTWHYDNNRDGLNPYETKLTPTNVNANTFGLLYNLAVDGQVYAQPLYVPSVAIPNQGTHNIVIVATENDSIYAFDADTGGSALWHTNFGTPVPSNDIFNGYTDITPIIGITSTPVINMSGTGTGTMYVLAKTWETNQAGNQVAVQRLHAINIATGLDVANSPVIISATVAGTGDGTNGSGQVPFDPLYQAQRPGLLLLGSGANATVYIGWASHGDVGPYHGWLMGYNATTLEQTAVFNTTPNAVSGTDGGLAAGGIWMSGSGLAANGLGIFVATGNGLFQPSNGSYGDAILRITTPYLKLDDYFSPTDQQSLDDDDTDQGSGGVVLLPKSVGSSTHPYLLVQVGKEGSICLCDQEHLGGNGTANNIVQFLQGAVAGLWSCPAYFNGNIYMAGAGGNLVDFTISNATMSTSPVAQSQNGFGFPGATPTISSNNLANGIVWAVDSSQYGSPGPAVLYAYQASNVANTLYSSNATNGRDQMDNATKFVTPLVENGKVYVGTADSLAIFGLAKFAAQPSVSEPTGVYNAPIQVTISDTTPHAQVYYSLDGSVPSNTSNTSMLYNGPITISSNAELQARAYATGYVGSAISTPAYYQISPVIGNGAGLYGQYYNNQKTPTGTPTATETDPTINFDWNGASPIAGVAGTNWCAKWTGYIEAESTGNYVFQTVSDDGCILAIGGKDVISDWQEQAATAYYSSPIPLVAGKKYAVTLWYFQGPGASSMTLSWQTLGMPLEIIPQSQLFPANP